MARTRKGKTRTGAIPECMAAMMTPQRSQRIRMNAFLEAGMHAAATHLMRAYYASGSGVGQDLYDGVALFAKSHPGPTG